jgi:alpha-L-rhamnosidase
MYLSYGDRRVLETQYPSMMKWVRVHADARRGRLSVDGGFHIRRLVGLRDDALGLSGSDDGEGPDRHRLLRPLDRFARPDGRVLGKTEDQARYDALLEKIKGAFVKEFVTPEGRIGENTQTAYVLALQFDLLPEALRKNAAERLADEVRERKHLTTGFLGTPYLLHVLSNYGYLDVAYMLLQRKEYPSWLYPVTKGATTIWERWDGIKADGSFQDAGMNSFNHLRVRRRR